MRLKFLLATLLLSTAAAQAETDTVVVTGSSYPPTTSILPSKGMTKASVTQRFGQPTLRHATVGGASKRQPPITRWDYGNFAVVFEYDHVVDAVEKDHPAPVKVQSGLQPGTP